MGTRVERVARHTASSDEVIDCPCGDRKQTARLACGAARTVVYRVMIILRLADMLLLTTS